MLAFAVDTVAALRMLVFHFNNNNYYNYYNNIVIIITIIIVIIIIIIIIVIIIGNHLQSSYSVPVHKRKFANELVIITIRNYSTVFIFPYCFFFAFLKH